MIRSATQFRCNTCHRISKRTSTWAAVDNVCGRCYRTQCMLKGRAPQIEAKDLILGFEDSKDSDSGSSASSSSYCDISDCNSSDELTFDSDSLSESFEFCESEIMDARYVRGDWFSSDDHSLCCSEKEMVCSPNTAATEPETPSDDELFDGDLNTDSMESSESESIDSRKHNHGHTSEVEVQNVSFETTNMSQINHVLENTETDGRSSNDSNLVHTMERFDTYCINCKREALSCEETRCDALECQVVLTDVKVTALNFRKCITWRSFSRRDVKKYETVKLCFQCCILFSNSSVVRKRPGWDVIWPSYIWKLLIFEGNHVPGDSNLIRAIPHQWLKYWSRNLERLGKWRNEESEVITVDVTLEKREFSNITKELKLGELKKGCDRFLIPRILCPWGCTSYLHHKGSVSFDAIISRYFLNVTFAGSQCSETAYDKVKSARGDFFSGDVDVHLHNPEWSVHPSVAFLDGEGPVFLTCQEHDGGTKDHYFHLPKTGSCLPSSRSDYLSHAVLRSRTLKASKAHQYSNSYQLNKCTAGYCGIDTCYVSDSRHFDFQSHITEMNECRSYFGREDIRGLVSRLREAGSISDDLASDYIEGSEKYFTESDAIQSLCAGGTMMTLRDTMNLQKLLHEPQVIEVRSAYNVTETRHVKRMWPLSRVYIHTVDGYGAAFSNIGRMASVNNVRDYRLLWTTCFALVSVSSLWEVVASNVTCCDEWHGHLLSLLSKKVIDQAPRLSSKERNPFDINAKGYKCTPEDMFCRLTSWCSSRFAVSPLEFSEFKPEQLMNIFDKEIANDSLSVMPMPGNISLTSLEDQTRNVSENVQAILFYRVEGQHSICDAMFDGVYVNGVYYELRFMSSTIMKKEMYKEKKRRVILLRKRRRRKFLIQNMFTSGVVIAMLDMGLPFLVDGGDYPEAV